MDKKLKILYKKVGQEPELLEINHTLDEMQNLVDGLIEVVPYKNNILLICNDEGKLLNMKANILFDNDCIAGNCFFVGDDYENASFKDLTDKQVKEIKEMLEQRSVKYLSPDEEMER